MFKVLFSCAFFSSQSKVFAGSDQFVPVHSRFTEICRQLLAKIFVHSDVQGKQFFYARASVVRRTLDNLVFEKRIGTGGQLYVYDVPASSDLVIKRLRWGHLHKQGQLNRGQYFKKLEADHLMIKRYFGDAFVPQTRFIELPKSLHVSEAAEPTLKGPSPEKEYVMIQRKIFGNEFYVFSPEFKIQKHASKELKQNLTQFIYKYRRMQKDGLTIEDQIMIDEGAGRVWISDTNFPRNFQELMRMGHSFFKTFGISEDSLRTPVDLFEAIRKVVPEFQAISASSYSQFIDSLHPLDGALTERIFSRLKSELGEETAIGFRRTMWVLGAFPPYGDNYFIRSIIKTYQLETHD